MKKNNNLFFLWGMMGTGKSYWANHLAFKLNIKSVDTDELIESSLLLKTATIFEKFGESFFREREREVLHQLILNTNTPTIVATGGGMPCFFDNALKMNENGITFFINSSTSILCERVLKSIEKRPLLKNYNSSELLIPFIESKLVERLPFYSQADYTFSDDFIDENIFLTTIQKHLNKNEY